MKIKKKHAGPAISKAPPPIVPLRSSGIAWMEREKAERKAAEEREAAEREANEAAKRLKPADFSERLKDPAWRFFEAAHLLEGFEPCAREDFRASDKDTEPKGSPRHRVAVMYDRLKGAADLGQIKPTKGQGGALALQKMQPQDYIQWAHERGYALPRELKQRLQQPKELHAREEHTYQHIIGALARIILGEKAGCDPHPSFLDANGKPSRDRIKAHLHTKFGAAGLSVSNLNRKLPDAEDALAAALGEKPTSRRKRR